MVRSEDVVRLNPRRSPGRLNRKALAYASEIGRLWSEGHSIAAIAEALLDAGVMVSLCTVRREIKRHKALPQHDESLSGSRNALTCAPRHLRAS
jgi:hypothetical protein